MGCLGLPQDPSEKWGTDGNVSRNRHFRRGVKRLAPRARFELATLRLTAECSTIELPGNISAGFQFT